MPAPRKPQDHKPKVSKVDGFPFTAAGVEYVLPFAEKALGSVSGRQLRDATIGGTEGQLALGFTMLEAVEADRAALDALYDLPAADMLVILERWMGTARPNGATLPQS